MTGINWHMRAENGAILARVLNFALGLEQTKITSRLYDGSYHMQTVGSAAEYADITIFADSLEKRDAVNAAEAGGDILVVDYRGGIYAGYIQQPVVWAPFRRGRSYTGTLRLLLAVSA